MNILIFTSARSAKATGGHLHSTYHITEALATCYNVKLITLGKEENEFIATSDHYLGFTTIASSKCLSLKKRIYTLIKGYNPDVVMFFIPELALYFRFFRIFPKTKFVIIKCGGRNPIRNKWIKTENMVVFSRENYQWFKENPYYKDVNISLIPNRVKQVQVLQAKNRVIVKNNSTFNVLRIARFSDSYIASHIQLINLIKRLKDDGYNIHLYLMGTINSQSRFEEVSKEAKESRINHTIITEAEMVKEASKYLYLGDCVLGTGRSAQEAISLGIPTMVPAVNSPFPILLTKANYANYLDFNFSERAIASNDDISNNYNNIINLINDLKYRESCSKEMKDIFNHELSTDEIPRKYREVFEQATIKRKYNFSNMIYLMQSLIRWR